MTIRHAHPRDVPQLWDLITQPRPSGFALAAAQTFDAAAVELFGQGRPAWVGEYGTQVGWVARLARYDPHRGLAWLEVSATSDAPDPPPLRADALVALAEEASNALPLRRLFVARPGTRAADALYREWDQVLVPAGRLRRHRYHLGSWVDLVVSAVPVRGADGLSAKPAPFEARPGRPRRLGSGTPPAPGRPAPRLRGRHVELTPLGPDNLGVLHRWATDDVDLQDLLFGQRLPVPARLAIEVDQATFQTVLIRDGDSGQWVGCCMSTALDRRHRHASMVTYIEPAFRSLGWPLEAPLLYLDWMLQRLDLIKVYLEVDRATDDPLIDAIHRLADLEARLPDHGLYRGRRVPRHVFATYAPEVDALVGAVGSEDRASHQERRRRGS